MKRTATVLVALMLLSAGTAGAAGLAIPEQGAAALGMAASMTARNEDLSAMFYNPAAINFVQGREAMIGLTPITPSHEYHPLAKDDAIFDKATANKNTFFPPYLYAAMRTSRRMVIGIGVNAPYGLGTDWETDWAGRYTSTYAEISTVHITPVASYRPTDNLSFGVSFSYVTSNATLEKMVDTGLAINPALKGTTALDSQFGLEGDGTGWAYSLGLFYNYRDRQQFGISYSGAYDIDYEGKAEFDHQEAAIKSTVFDLTKLSGASDPVANATATGTYNAILAKMPLSQDGTATLHMPWTLNMGWKTNLSDTWDLSADVNIIGWEVYDNLVIDFEKDKPSDTKVLKKDWSNTTALRVGTSYDYRENIVLRGGLMYDFNPVPDETLDGQLPDSNRYGIGIGAGYKLGAIRFDAGYLLLNFSKREKENGVGWETDTTGDGSVDRFDVPAGYPIGNGKYYSRAHLFSLAASISF